MSLRSAARRIYERSPQKLKTIIARAYASLPNRLQFGADYPPAEALTSSAEKWTPQESCEYQDKQLERLIARANDMEFYKARGGIRSLRDAPLLTKDELKQFSATLPSEDIKRFKAEGVTTGGSTGAPLKLYLDRKGLALQKTIRASHFRLVSQVSSPRIASFRGTRFDPVLPGDSKFAVRSLDGKTLFLNSFTLAPSTAEQFYDAWNRFKPDTVFAFPSTLGKFAALARMDKPQLHIPEGCVTSSESLFDDQRKLIEEALKAPVFDTLGMSECECIAFQREPDGPYMVSTHVCYVELLRDGKDVRPGESGEIVLTHLHNFSQPIIRYRTGDWAVAMEGGIMSNGGHFALASVEGREQENLLAADGSPVSMSNFNMHSDYWIGVLEYQLVQEDLGKAILKLKTGAPLSHEQLRLIGREIHEKFGDRFEVRLEEVRRLWRTPAGKTPRVVSSENAAHFDYAKEGDEILETTSS